MAMDTFRIEVGKQHEVSAGNIVGAIANELDIDSEYIGRIEIHDDHSTVDLPEGMPPELLESFKKIRVRSRALAASRIGTSESRHKPRPAKRPDKPRHKTTKAAGKKTSSSKAAKPARKSKKPKQ